MIGILAFIDQVLSGKGRCLAGERAYVADLFHTKHTNKEKVARKQAKPSSNSRDIRKTSVMPIGQVADEYQQWPDGIPKNQINILPIGAAIAELSTPKSEPKNLRMPIELPPEVAKVAACDPTFTQLISWLSALNRVVIGH